MAKNWETKLDNWECLRIKKIGNYYFAYARKTIYGGQRERYLGRCEEDGTIISDRRRMRKRIKIEKC